MGLFDRIREALENDTNDWENEGVSQEVLDFEEGLKDQEVFGETGNERLQDLIDNDASSAEIKEEIMANIRFETNADQEVLSEAMDKLSPEDLSELHDTVNSDMAEKGFIVDAEFREVMIVEDKEARFDEIREIVNEKFDQENDQDSFVDSENEVSKEQSIEAEMGQ